MLKKNECCIIIADSYFKMEEFGLMDMNLNLMKLSLPKLHGLDTSDWTVVVSGITVVIGILLLLVVAIFVYGFIVSKLEASAKKREQKKARKNNSAEDAAPAPATPVSAPAPAPVVEQGISGEVVAAISAAVYSMEGSGNVTITAIRKQSPITSRNPWSQAAVIDNTRPF